MSLKELLSEGSNGLGGSLLKGSDVPAGITTIVIEVAAWRKAPQGFGSPLILDLKKPIYGKTAWAVNRTNLKMLIKLYGENEEDLVGRKIKLSVISVTNPKTGQMVASLAVEPNQTRK